MSSSPSPNLAAFQAVIFDMDGVLIDSEPLWRRAEVRVLGGLGVPLTEEMCHQTMGLRVDEMVQHWHRTYPWQGATQEQVAEDILALVMDLVRQEGRPLPGVRMLLEALAGRSARVGLATSSPSVLIDCVLDALEFGPFFAATCSAENQPLGKPHPGVYLQAARLLDTPAEHCLAVEDSVNGVRAALAAGMTAAAVPAPDTTPDFPGEALVFPHMAELTRWLGL